MIINDPLDHMIDAMNANLIFMKDKLELYLERQDQIMLYLDRQDHKLDAMNTKLIIMEAKLTEVKAKTASSSGTLTSHVVSADLDGPPGLANRDAASLDGPPGFADSDDDVAGFARITGITGMVVALHEAHERFPEGSMHSFGTVDVQTEDPELEHVPSAPSAAPSSTPSSF